MGKVKQTSDYHGFLVEIVVWDCLGEDLPIFWNKGKIYRSHKVAQTIAGNVGINIDDGKFDIPCFSHSRIVEWFGEDLPEFISADKVIVPTVKATEVIPVFEAVAVIPEVEVVATDNEIQELNTASADIYDICDTTFFATPTEVLETIEVLPKLKVDTYSEMYRHGYDNAAICMEYIPDFRDKQDTLESVATEYGWSVVGNALYNRAGNKVHDVKIKRDRVHFLSDGKLYGSIPLSRPESLGKYIEKTFYARKNDTSPPITGLVSRLTPTVAAEASVKVLTKPCPSKRLATLQLRLNQLRGKLKFAIRRSLRVIILNTIFAICKLENSIEYDDPETVERAPIDRPIFEIYSELHSYVRSQVKIQGQKYYCSEEYRLLAPISERMYEQEKAKIKSENLTVALQAMTDCNLVWGDRVEWHNVGMVFSVEIYKGILVNKKGIPWVQLDVPIDGKKTCKWHKGFTKSLNTNKENTLESKISTSSDEWTKICNIGMLDVEGLKAILPTLCHDRNIEEVTVMIARLQKPPKRVLQKTPTVGTETEIYNIGPIAVVDSGMIIDYKIGGFSFLVDDCDVVVTKSQKHGGLFINVASYEYKSHDDAKKAALKMAKLSS